MKTSTLIGPALDWAVEKCEGTLDRRVTLRPGTSAVEAKLHSGEVWSLTPGSSGLYQKSQPSTDWSQGGPIIEREEINIGSGRAFKLEVSKGRVVQTFLAEGETILIAAMRCYVASKMGDEVDVPEQLR